VRVLLTGASGFVGSNVLKHLLDTTDWTFTCPCSFRHHGNPLRFTDDKRVDILRCDLRGEIPNLGWFDYILNFASESHVDRSIRYPVPFIENNVSSTLQLLEYARKNRPMVFLQFSTDEVFGPTSNQLRPSNPYAASKAAQEVLCMAYWRTYGVPVVITNSNNIVGPNQDPEKFVPKVIDLLKQGEPVTIHVTKDGPGRRYYNPVQNVASAISTVLELNTNRGSTNLIPRYRLPGGEELDNLEMAQLLAKILDVPLVTTKVNVEASLRPGYDRFYEETANNDLTGEGWVPPYTLEEGLREFVR
jgi:dTDP-glucose 4,6-dehydratase